MMIPLILQDGIDRKLLQSFIDMRKDNKKPLKQRGLDVLIQKLSRLESQGHCPNLLLERSIVNDWQDVFPNETTKKNQSFVADNSARDWANVSFMEKHTDKKWREGLQ